MREIIIALTQNPVGMCAAMLMGFVIIAFVIWYGFYMVVLPAMSVISATKVMLEDNRKKTARIMENQEKSCLVVGPELGYTMADGGAPVKKGEN